MFDQIPTGDVVVAAILAGLLWMLLVINLMLEAGESGAMPRAGVTATLAIVATAASLVAMVLLIP